MKPEDTPIVGPDVGDQRKLRPVRPVRSIDELIDFLEKLEEVFGPVERVRELTTGKHFKL